MKATLFIALKAGSRRPEATPKCLWYMLKEIGIHPVVRRPAESVTSRQSNYFIVLTLSTF